MADVEWVSRAKLRLELSDATYRAASWREGAGRSLEGERELK